MRPSIIACGVLAICVAGSGVTAQALSLTPPSTAFDHRLELSTGTMVHVRQFGIFEKRDSASSRATHPQSLTIYIETPTPSADTVRLAREAQEVATLHDSFAQSKGIGHIAVAVCRTNDCVQLRGGWSELFGFARARDGKWAVEKR